MQTGSEDRRTPDAPGRQYHDRVDTSGVTPFIPAHRGPRRRGERAGRAGGAGAEPAGRQDAIGLGDLGHLQRDGPAVRRPGQRDVRRPAADRPAAGRRGREAPSSSRTPWRTACSTPAHGVTAYWYGKTKAASLFGTGPCLGCDAHAGARLDPLRRRQGPLPRAAAETSSGCNVVSFFATADADPAARLVQERGQRAPRTCRGLKYRTVGLAADVMQAMGLAVTQLPGRRDHPGDGAGRDRRVRVQQPDLGPPLRRPGRGQELHARQLPPGLRVLRDHRQQAVLRIARARPAGDPRILRRGGDHRQLRGWRWTTTRRTCRG